MTLAQFSLRMTGLFAIAAGGLAIAIVAPGLTIKTALFGVAGIGAVLLLIMSGRPKEVLLGGYIIALTYNRQYLSFEGLLGDHGAQGLYWIPADLFLLGLLGVWLLEKALRAEPPIDAMAQLRRPPMMRSAWPVFVWLVAFILAALLAERADWAFNELARVLRFVLLVVWLHANMTRSLWYAAVAALALSALLQAGLGTLQVVLRADRNLLSVFGASSEAVFTQGGELDVLENRARGTMGHPNFLAPYLLFLVPAAFGVMLYSRGRLTRLLALGLLLAGVAGMIATKSRGPIVLLAGGLGIVALVAVRGRVLSVQTFLGGLVLACTLLVAAAIPFADIIYERIWGDFNASISFRSEYNSAAIRIWDDAPVFGIGPNNGTIGLARHSVTFTWLLNDLTMLTGGVPVRAVAPVHNVYLLILMETGLVGLAAFLTLLAAVMWRMAYGFRISQGAVRGLCLGLAAGLVTQLIQQFIDFSLWGDPSWYTLAILMAVAGTIPVLRPAWQ